jgi:tRNA A37 N6-isopentenylltransferase MiaA
MFCLSCVCQLPALTRLILAPAILQVAGGLLSEALMLLDRGMRANTNIATRAIGYRQALEFLQVRVP